METAVEPQTIEEPKVRRSATITVSDVAAAVAELAKKPFDAETFPYDILTIYRDTPKTTLANLKNGTKNPAHKTGGVLLKKVLYFQPCGIDDDPGAVADRLLTEKITEKNAPRFILVTNGSIVHIRDLKADEPPCNRRWDEDEYWGHFLLPLNARFDRAVEHEEHPADVKAATTLRRLYEAILKANPTWADGNHTHELNVFITRVLFCLYAEDTGIFKKKNLFTDTVEQYSHIDGHDVAELLDRLFRIMNVEDSSRPAKLSPIESAFPYVNGNLFDATLQIPTFDRLARRTLLECGDLDWTEINPDIFGSMLQTISDQTSRSAVGMHYTSRPNILKVLGPLFLDDIEREFNSAKDSAKALQSLLTRISNIRVFDPACGSGNFLIISYKELRRIEMRILARLAELAPNAPLQLSSVSLSNFYGLDIIDLACETARLSLWIAEHQMNVEFFKEFGKTKATLPLGKITTICRDNALTLDWTNFCPPKSGAETYVCGNPPYLGVNAQNKDQKADVIAIFSKTPGGYSKVDYVACWLIKFNDYLDAAPAAAGAFVASNSICQGEQVAFIWPYILSTNTVISFARTSFKWDNNAANNAGVACVIIGLRKDNGANRVLYTDTHQVTVKNINPYLVPSPKNIVVAKRKSPLSPLPELIKGDEAMDGGHLVLTEHEANTLISSFPAAAEIIRPFWGSKDLLYGIRRFVLWISDDQVAFASQIPPIASRLANVKRDRAKGGLHARRAAAWPHRFAFIHHEDVASIVIPETTSEKRRYLQIGVLGPRDIASHGLYVIYSPPAYILSLLSSRMHRIWTEVIGGKLESRLRYSSGLAYNTFPVPTLSDAQKKILGQHSRQILLARERHPGTTLADLYDPDEMPLDLRQAHHDNDTYIEEYIYGRAFVDDTQRMEYLFALYSRMIAMEEQSDLFSVKETA